MKIFGSDGFRCKIGTKYMTTSFLREFSQSISIIYHLQKFRKPIIIAKDTRKSGNIIEKIIYNNIIKYQIDVVLAGVIASPGLSKLLEVEDYSIGIMITASHNPHTDNGIKLFNSKGFKLDKKLEIDIENLIISRDFSYLEKKNKTGQLNRIENANYKYFSNINKITQLELNNNKSNFLLDVGNGALTSLVNEVFGDNKAFELINNTPNGRNINLECGALEIDNLYKNIRNKKNDFGVSFDGDGDRVVFVNKKLNFIPSEKIACLFFEYLLKFNTSRKVVTTEIANLGFKENISLLGGDVQETKVGDRYVIDRVLKDKALFGFEPSGHFFLPDLNNSMDGLSALLLFLKIIEDVGDRIEQKINKLNHYARIEKSIELFSDIHINKLRKDIEQFIDKKNEKIIIRKSMWDPVLRIYYDYKIENKFLYFEEKIKNFLENYK